jgi:hypothetical protein
MISALDARLGYFQPISKPASPFPRGGRNHTGQSNGHSAVLSGWGSRLSAYGLNELFGSQYCTFRAGYLHDIFTLPPFVGKKVYAIGIYEFGKMYGVPNESKFPNDIAGRDHRGNRGGAVSRRWQPGRCGPPEAVLPTRPFVLAAAEFGADYGVAATRPRR